MEKTGDTFTAHLLDAIKQSVRVVAEDEIKAAQERVANRVREEVGALAIRIAQFSEVSMLRDRLVIELRLPDIEHPKPRGEE